MRARDVAARLPKPDELERFSLAIAALDAVLCPDWEYRSFSFDPKWAKGERMASMRNGSGDGYFIVFAADGVVVRAFDHESELSPWVRDDGKVAPGILDGLPAKFERVIEEPAFRTEDGPETELTFCAWWQTGDAGWHAGPVDDDGGAADLLKVVSKATAAAYRAHAVDALEVKPALKVVKRFVALEAADDAMITALDRTADVAAVRAELGEMGYPVAGS